MEMENNIISQSEKLTFDNFVVGANNRFAYAAAKRVADEVDSKSPEILPFSCNPLLIYGEKGVGKTHLLNAIRNEIKIRKPNLQIAFVDESNPIDKVSTNADVLLVDDVQLYMNDEFFKIYNSFIENNKQVVLTANKIYSQFDCGLMADIALANSEIRSRIKNLTNNSLNGIYETISELIGFYNTKILYENFCGRQICFPTKLFSSKSTINEDKNTSQLKTTMLGKSLDLFLNNT